MSGIRFKGSSRRRILDSWPNSSMRIVLNAGIHRLKSGVNNWAAWLVFGAVHLGANVTGFYSVDEHLHVIVAIYAVVDYTVDWKTSCSLFCNLPRVASLYEIVCKYLHLVRKLAFLCNSIWPPSAIFDLLGKVVGSSTKAYSWWLCKNVGLSSLKSCVWIFVVHAWKSYSWSQVLFYFCRLDFQKLREHCSYPKGSITYCPEWRVLSRLSSRSDAPCSSISHRRKCGKLWGPSSTIRRRRKNTLAKGTPLDLPPTTAWNDQKHSAV